VGGEAQETIETVYAYNVTKRRWSRLPDLPTPRHGLGVVAFEGRVYTLAGGPHPGLFVSSANEYLRVPYDSSGSASTNSSSTFSARRSRSLRSSSR